LINRDKKEDKKMGQISERHCDKMDAELGLGDRGTIQNINHSPELGKMR